MDVAGNGECGTGAKERALALRQSDGDLFAGGCGCDFPATTPSDDPSLCGAACC